MDPQKLFYDRRLQGACVYCGSFPETRDHVPPKVLLDDPLPRNLPVVEACQTCNNGFSLDEQYLACFLECTILGSADPDRLARAKIRRIMQENPLLATRIGAACHHDQAGGLHWDPEIDRVRNIVLKLARGHAAYEYAESQTDAPERIWVAPLQHLTPEQREEFETPPVEEVWPEIGSRAFVGAIETGGPALIGGWRVIQEGRYRYLVSLSGGISVRMVLSEYLACEVSW